MDWLNKFRVQLCLKLENEKSIIDTEKSNSNFLFVSKHINPIQAENLVNIIKLTHRDYFIKMKFDANEVLPGIDGTQILEIFNNSVIEILKDTNLYDRELAYKIFLRNYLYTFQELIFEYEDFIKKN